jgi:hypothetical protein
VTRSLLVRIFDKQMRIATRKDYAGESPYRDIAGYGILGAAKDDRWCGSRASAADARSGTIVMVPKGAAAVSASIEFVWDSRDLNIWRGGGKVEFALGRALRLAGNQALRAMGAESNISVRRRKRMREGEVMKGLPLVFTGSRTAIKDMVWRMKVSGKPVPLSAFPHIDTRKQGVLVRVNVGGSTKRLPGAFVATLRSGHEGIFKRRGKARLPIDELFSSRISDTMKDEAIILHVQGVAFNRMQTAYQRGLERELGKLKRKGDL